jgi:hypothetical protein
MINIFQYIVRVAKKDAVFLYFQLESNEGLCFYSTKDGDKSETFRMIDICGSLDFQAQVKELLLGLQNEIQLEIIEENLKET